LLLVFCEDDDSTETPTTIQLLLRYPRNCCCCCCCCCSYHIRQRTIRIRSMRAFVAFFCRMKAHTYARFAERGDHHHNRFGIGRSYSSSSLSQFKREEIAKKRREEEEEKREREESVDCISLESPSDEEE